MLALPIDDRWPQTRRGIEIMMEMDALRSQVALESFPLSGGTA